MARYLFVFVWKLVIHQMGMEIVGKVVWVHPVALKSEGASRVRQQLLALVTTSTHLDFNAEISQ